MNTFVGPSGTGSVFVGSADHVEHTKHASISVDGGQVRIDATDDEHVIRIMHTTNDGIDILAALDKGTGATTMRIDSDGAVRAPEVIYGASNKSLVQLDATMVAATSTDIGTDNLVMRDQALGTEIDNLHVVADSSNYTATFPPAGLYFTEGTCRGELTLLEDTRIRPALRRRRHRN